MQPLYVDDLGPNGDADACTHASDDELRWIHAKCHLRSPAWVVIDGDVLAVLCAECYGPIVRLHLARRPGPPSPNDAPSPD